MSAIDMTAWSPQIVERFKALLNVREISNPVDDKNAGGDDDEAKLLRAAMARNSNPQAAQAAHEALAVLAFSGYQDWCEYDDDWTKNCLGQVLDDQQSNFLVKALQDADKISLDLAVEQLAGDFRDEWQRAANADAAQASGLSESGLNPAENSESWKYSRTPGTRYYIFHEGQYLYSDDKDAPLPGWATAETRDNEAAARATEWESGSGVFYTTYETPAYVGGLAHVFGESKDGPWILSRSQAEQLLAVARRSPGSGGVSGAGSPIEPYYDTGHFTKYENGVYSYGETQNTVTWYATYAELADAIAERAALAEADLGLDEEVEDLIREAEESGDDEYLMAVSLLGEEEVRRIAAEIAQLP